MQEPQWVRKHVVATRLRQRPSTQCTNGTSAKRTLGELECLAIASLEGAADVLVEGRLSHTTKVVVGHDILLDRLTAAEQSVELPGNEHQKREGAKKELTCFHCDL